MMFFFVVYNFHVKFASLCTVQRGSEYRISRILVKYFPPIRPFLFLSFPKMFSYSLFFFILYGTNSYRHIEKQSFACVTFATILEFLGLSNLAMSLIL